VKVVALDLECLEGCWRMEPSEVRRAAGVSIRDDESPGQILFSNSELAKLSALIMWSNSNSTAIWKWIWSHVRSAIG
jgi:hypothetical protein